MPQDTSLVFAPGLRRGRVRSCRSGRCPHGRATRGRASSAAACCARDPCLYGCVSTTSRPIGCGSREAPCGCFLVRWAPASARAGAGGQAGRARLCAARLTVCLCCSCGQRIRVLPSCLLLDRCRVACSHTATVAIRLAAYAAASAATRPSVWFGLARVPCRR